MEKEKGNKINELKFGDKTFKPEDTPDDFPTLVLEAGISPGSIDYKKITKDNMLKYIQLMTKYSGPIVESSEGIEEMEEFLKEEM